MLVIQDLHLLTMNTQCDTTLAKDSLFVGDHVRKVASFPKEDLAKSGYEPDMKFKFKKHPSIFLATH